MRNNNFGDRLIDGLQDLLCRMRTGLPIPATELRRVATPNGAVMLVRTDTEITFGDREDDQNNGTKAKATKTKAKERFGSPSQG